MISIPSSLRRLIKELAEIPSIGPRQATRIAFFLVSEGRTLAKALSFGIHGIEDIATCTRCYFIFESSGASDKPEKTTENGSRSAKASRDKEGLCDICGDPNRDPSIVMIVEKETDLISLENTGKYKGRYLILGQMPKTGLLEDWQKERLRGLKAFIGEKLDGQAKEIILGLNPTSLGDFHAGLLMKELAGAAAKMSRLGRGLPQGGEIEFADGETLGSALEGRS